MNNERIMKSLLFQGIEHSELKKLLRCLHAYTKEYKKNEMILQRGDYVTSIGLLIKGQAHIIKDDYWGNRTILNEIEVGELFAESYACITNKELEVSLLATKDSEVLFLDIRYLFSMCSSCQFHQRLIQNLFMISSLKNLSLTRKIEHITKRTTKEKILSYISSLCLNTGQQTVTIPFNRQQLADYLSVDRSALSSALSRMQKEGLITYNKHTFTLH